MKVSPDVFSPKERLLRVLDKQGAERPPVICPGGMMNAAIVDVMTKRGTVLPDAHHEAALIAALAQDVAEETGFENFGFPFCMTVEAEALGSTVNFGSLSCEPKIAAEPYSSVDEVPFLPPASITKSRRAAEVIGAANILSKKTQDIPVIASITGPVSLAGSLVDPMVYLKEFYKKGAAAHKLLDYLSGQLIDYALCLLDNGADVICIADPTATGEILGPRLFANFAVLYINKITDAIIKHGGKVIVHICGNINSVKKDFPHIQCSAVSTDAMVNLQELKEEYTSLTTMGNLSTYMLQFGKPDKIQRAAEKLLSEGIDVIAPACGLSTSTPLENISTFTDTVKHYASG